jgi:hypothetical protein
MPYSKTSIQRVDAVLLGKWTIESIEERKWLRSLVRTFAQQGQD